MARFETPKIRVDSLDDLARLKREVWDALESESNVIETAEDDSVLFAGDLHGHLDCFEAAVSTANSLKADRIVFLGDYVDRGAEQWETLESVLRLVLGSAGRVTALRGNHEDSKINQIYGFRSVLTKRFGRDMFRAAELCQDIFEVLPLAVISGSYIGLHGGIPSLGSFREIGEIPKPHSRVDALKDEKLSRLLDEVRWNDPDDTIATFGMGRRGGPSRMFGKKAARNWLKEAGASHLVRGHESSRGPYASLWNGLVLHIYSSVTRPDLPGPVFGFKTSHQRFLVVDGSGGTVEKFV